MKIVAPNIGYRIAFLVALFLAVLIVKIFSPVENHQTALVFSTIPDQKTPLDGRNLSFYEVGGTLHRCLGPSHNDPNMIIDSWKEYLREWRKCRSKTEEGRQFLLKNWKNRYRTYLIVNNSYLDTTSIYHIFMESWRNEEGMIKIRHETCQTYRTLKPCITESETSDIKLRSPVRGDNDPQKGDKILSFVDQSGREVFSF